MEHLEVYRLLNTVSALRNLELLKANTLGPTPEGAEACLVYICRNRHLLVNIHTILREWR